MVKSESFDIRFLKKRLIFLIEIEEYEIAAKIKEWIIELGGDPDISEVLQKNILHRKN
jgi:protein-arginine kinase activator protein McsA